MKCLPGRRRGRLLAATLLAAGMLALCLALLPESGRARALDVRHVDDDPGCQGRAPCYQTIQAAVDAAAEGELIQVAPGRYTETVVLEDRALVFEGPGAGGPAEPDNPDDHAIWVGQAGGVRGAALTVDARNTDVRGVRVRGFRIMSASVGVMLVGRRVGDPVPLPPGRGASVLDTAVLNAQIGDNYFADIGGGVHEPGGALVAYWADETVFEGNVVLGGDAGVHVLGGGGARVRDNRIEETGGPGVSVEVHGDRLEIIGNAVMSAAGHGIQVRNLVRPGLRGQGRQILLSGNEVTSAGGEGIRIAAEGGGTLSGVRLIGNRVLNSGAGEDPVAKASLGGIALEGGEGVLSDVELIGGEVRGTRRSGDGLAAGVHAQFVSGTLFITDAVLIDGAGPGLVLVDVPSVRVCRSTVSGNAEGVHLIETAAVVYVGERGPARAGDRGSVVLGGAPECGNLLAGNTGAALVLENATNTTVSTPDVQATYNDWGTAYGPVIEEMVRHRPDDPRLGLVTYLPALGVPESVEVTADPPRLVADGVSEAELTASIVDAIGRPVADDALVLWSAAGGALTRSGRLVEAEDEGVTLRGDWRESTSEVFGPFSGRAYVRSGTVGDELEWKLEEPALLIRYGQSLLNTGTFRVHLDGALLGTVVTLGPDKKWVERVLARDLSAGPHTMTLRVEAGEVNVDLLAGGITGAGGRATARLRAGAEIGSAWVTVGVRGAHGPRAGTVGVPFTAGPPDSMALRFGAPTLPVGGVTTTVTAKVQDAWDRPVPDGTPVRFATTLGLVSPSQSASAGGFAQTVLESGIDVGVAVVQAEAGNLVVSRTIPIGPGPPATLRISASRDAIPANSTAVTDLEVNVWDAWGHPVSDDTLVQLTTTLGTVEPRVAGTSRGVARARLRSGVEAGTAYVRAVAGVASGEGTVTFSALDMRLTKAVEPQSVVVPGEDVTFALAYANVGSGTVYGVVIEDPVPTGLISPSLTASGPPLEQLRGRPPLAWRVARLRPGERGSITVTLRVDARRRWVGRTQITNRAWINSDDAAEMTPSDNTSEAGIIVVPAAVYSVTVAAPDRLPVGGATGAVTAEVTDRYGNPAVDGTGVTFSTDLGTVEPVAARTRDGFARTTFTTGTRSGVATVRALSVEDRGGFARVRVMPGPATLLDLASERAWLPVGGASTVITAALADQFDNPVVAEPISFETDLGILMPTAAATGPDGQVTTTLESGVRPGLATVSARGAFLTEELVIPFRAGPAALIDLTFDRQRVPVGATVRATARVMDRYENPVSGATVTFSSTVGTVDPRAAVTNAQGRAVTEVTVDRSGSALVRAAVGDVTAERELLVESHAFLPLVPNQ